MATKLKVKDLATELGIGHKEILQHLRDMDIQVKSLSSTLEDDEAAQVRKSLRSAAAPQTEVVRREVQPGVIVRSRKAKPGSPEDTAHDAAHAEDDAPAVEAVGKPAEAKPAEAHDDGAEKKPAKPARAA